MSACQPSRQMVRNLEVRDACEDLRVVLEQHPGPWMIWELSEMMTGASTCSEGAINSAILELMADRELVRDDNRFLVYVAITG